MAGASSRSGLFGGTSYTGGELRGIPEPYANVWQL